MPDPAIHHAGHESIDRTNQEEERPPQRLPGGAATSSVSLIARRRDGKAEGVLPVTASSPPRPSTGGAGENDRRERHRSFVRHPSNVGRVRGLRSMREEQASAPQAGHQV